MTRQEKIDFILDELSLGEHDAIPHDIAEMVASKSDHCLGILVKQIAIEKKWMNELVRIAS